MSENKIINSRIQSLRKLMKDRNIEMYIIPSEDFHESEVSSEYFKARKFMSGLRGSAGTLLVTLDEAKMWVDGRYFLQAEIELAGTCIDKMEMGEEGVPSLNEYISENMPVGGTLGFDGRVISASNVYAMLEELKNKNINLHTHEDLVDIIWENRPAFPANQGFVLPEKYTGMSAKDKIIKLQKILAQNNYDAYITSSLGEIAWLTNVRGRDVKYFPVLLGYMIVTQGKSYAFFNPLSVSDEVKNYLNENDIEIRNYEDIYDYVRDLDTAIKMNSYSVEADEQGTVLIDANKLNFSLYDALPDNLEIIDDFSPVDIMKACKNDTEIQNIKNAHLKDGVALTKFIYWIKQAVKTGKIDEADVADKLDNFRAEQDGFIEPSFKTITAYGKNAAVVHYTARKETAAILEPRSMILVDSGGHYMDGTTDVTRTIALGDVTEEEKRNFTAVLAGMLSLANTKFLYGMTGQNLDILARNNLFEFGLDYKHGTGHGVGFVGEIHESPNAFRWKFSENLNDVLPIERGMVTSDEPSVYITDKYGIRIENLLLAVNDIKNEYGQFMKFESLTIAPIDVELVDKEQLGDKLTRKLNEYNRMVYEKLSPYLDSDVVAWLQSLQI